MEAARSYTPPPLLLLLLLLLRDARAADRSSYGLEFAAILRLTDDHPRIV